MTRKWDLTYTILLAAVLVALGFIVWLARENSMLKNRISQGRLNAVSSGDISGPPELQPGDVAAPFDATDWEGKPVSIRYDGKSKYLFFIFSAFCGSCNSQIPIWSDLAAQAKATEAGEANGKTNGYQPVGVSLESPGDRRVRFGQLRKNAWLLVSPSLGIQRTFRATSIPLVVLVGADGLVEWVHYGVLSGGQAKELSVRLGGGAVARAASN
jgi:hypothetical protein